MTPSAQEIRVPHNLRRPMLTRRFLRPKFALFLCPVELAPSSWVCCRIPSARYWQYGGTCRAIHDSPTHRNGCAQFPCELSPVRVISSSLFLLLSSPVVLQGNCRDICAGSFLVTCPSSGNANGQYSGACISTAPGVLSSWFVESPRSLFYTTVVVMMISNLCWWGIATHKTNNSTPLTCAVFLPEQDNDASYGCGGHGCDSLAMIDLALAV